MTTVPNPSLDSAVREMAATVVRITIRAQPSASRSAVVGIVAGPASDGAVKVALAAPPVDGAANDELVRTLARWLEVPRGAVSLVRGHTGRAKLVEVSGISRAHVLAKLSELERP